MSDDDDDFTPENQLRRLEQEIADLEPSVDEARRRVGNRDEGTGDQEDYAAAMTEIAEQEAVLDTLRERRDALREKLGR
jgi:chromosome segregation ATPase